VENGWEASLQTIFVTNERWLITLAVVGLCLIVDKYDIIIPPNAPAGRYELEVGLYDATTGQRLPLLDKTGQRQNERVLLSDRIMVK
jgi:hypothetical protein